MFYFVVVTDTSNIFHYYPLSAFLDLVLPDEYCLPCVYVLNYFYVVVSKPRFLDPF